MKTLASLVFLALFFAPKLFAQTAHTDNLTYTASATPGTTSNVYRAPGSCTTATAFVQIASGQPAGGPYVDPSPLVGTQCYYVTAFLNGVESAPSNKVSVTSTVSLQPPTGLAVTPN